MDSRPGLIAIHPEPPCDRMTPDGIEPQAAVAQAELLSGGVPAITGQSNSIAPAGSAASVAASNGTAESSARTPSEPDEGSLTAMRQRLASRSAEPVLRGYYRANVIPREIDSGEVSKVSLSGSGTRERQDVSGRLSIVTVANSPQGMSQVAERSHGISRMSGGVDPHLTMGHEDSAHPWNGTFSDVPQESPGSVSLLDISSAISRSADQGVMSPAVPQLESVGPSLSERRQDNEVGPWQEGPTQGSGVSPNRKFQGLRDRGDARGESSGLNVSSAQSGAPAPGNRTTGAEIRDKAVPSSPSNQAVAQELPTSVQNAMAAAAAKHAARALHQVLGSELQLGVQTDAFGRVTIHTSNQGSLIGARLTLENDHGSASLITQLPQAEERILYRYGVEASLAVGRNDAAQTATAQEGDQPRQQAQLDESISGSRSRHHRGRGILPVSSPSSYSGEQGRLDIRV